MSKPNKTGRWAVDRPGLKPMQPMQVH